MTLKHSIEPSHRMTYEETVARARALAPAIAERAAAAEAQGRQPEETIREWVEAGLMRLLTPARWGGHELSFNAHADSTIEIARADASAGWCYVIFIAHSLMLAHFSEEAQRDVWANDPDALISSSFAPGHVGHVAPTDGGYVLSGSWPWSSGVDHSAWCMLGGFLPTSGDAQPAFALFMVPRSDYVILDTWFVAGLRASGSKSVLLKDVFVPEYRMVRMADLTGGRGPGTTVNTGPLYKVPVFSGGAMVAPLLGATIGAYETWRDACRNKFTAFSREQLAAYPHVQIRLAEIEAEIQAARLFLQKNLDEINSGRPISHEQQVRSARNSAYAAKLCVGAMERIFLASGGSANYETNPLQRYWRDVHAMAAHAALNFDAAGEAFGQMELGLPPTSRRLF